MIGDSKLSKVIAEVDSLIFGPNGWSNGESGESYDVRWTRPSKFSDELFEFIVVTDLSNLAEEVIVGWQIGLAGEIVECFERFFASKITFLDSIVKADDFSEHFLYQVSLQWLLLSEDECQYRRVNDVLQVGTEGEICLDEDLFSDLYQRSIMHFARYANLNELVELLSRPDRIKSRSPAKGIVCPDNTINVALVYLAAGHVDEGVRILEDAIAGRYLPTEKENIAIGLASDDNVKIRAKACLEFIETR